MENDDLVHFHFFYRSRRDRENLRRQSFFFVPEFSYSEKKNLLTSFIQMLEVKQKRVPKFFNSITDTPEVLKLWFWGEKWLLRIFTVFSLWKVDLFSNYWAKLLKKVQKHHFFGCVGVAFFFGVSFSRKKAVIFFRFSLASKKWFLFYDWTTKSWVIKFLSVGVYGMY